MTQSPVLTKENEMKKKTKKLTLNRETLLALEEQRMIEVVGGLKTIDATYCVTNCPVTQCQTTSRACG
jgi:hypothetical protein